MADNYLEKKMEEFRSGKRVVRRPSASLEGLLSTLAESDAGVGAGDGAGVGAGARSAAGGVGAAGAGAAGTAVMPAQVDAVVRAGKRLPEAAAFRFEVESACGTIRVLGPSSPRRYVFEAGEVLLAMRLKAAELHLRSFVELNPEVSAPANPLLFTLSVFK